MNAAGKKLIALLASTATLSIGAPALALDWTDPYDYYDYGYDYDYDDDWFYDHYDYGLTNYDDTYDYYSDYDYDSDVFDWEEDGLFH